MWKKGIIPLLGSIFLLFCNSASALTPAFPGAEGAGKYALGGRGGNVVEVNSLADYDPRTNPGPGEPNIPGSFRWALDNDINPPPKIIVLRVSGTIELKLPLEVSQPRITIAGQTAPGDGITLKNFPLNISSPETIVRFIRVRLGERKGEYGGRDNDCMHIQVRGSNIIVDHCSFSWGIDETLSPQGDAPVIIPPYVNNPTMDNLTVQWCILSNPLNKSVHTEGEHGKATLAYGCHKGRFSFHHNIYAHSIDRNPRVAQIYDRDYTSDPNGLWFDFRNNVVYNWGRSPPSFSVGANKVTQVNFVGNYYKSGVNSGGDTYAYEATDLHGKGYFSDNRMNGAASASPWDLVTFVGFTPEQITAYKQSSPIPIGSVSTDDSLTAYARVLTDAGCTAPYRDSVDARVVDEIATGTGEVIDCTTPGDFYYQVGTAKGGAANKIILADTYPARETGQDNYYIEITGGTGAGQTRFITFYHASNAPPDITDPNRYYLVSPDWDVVPDSTSTFGVIVDCTKNAGGWPVLNSTTPPVDTDHDGMPDDWESDRGLNPNNVDDGKLDQDSDGYTNVEEYLDYLAVQSTELPPDFDRDGDVDNNDLDLFTEDWLENNCDDVPRKNLDDDCDVDFGDYAVLADYWMEVY